MATPTRGAYPVRPMVTDLLSRALTCQRCRARPVSAQLVFDCNHKFCGYCLGQMWNEEIQKVDCTICQNPGEYPDTGNGSDTPEDGHRYSPVVRTHCRTPQGISAEASQNTSLVRTPTDAPSSVSQTPRLQRAETENIDVLPLPVPVTEASPRGPFAATSVAPSPLPYLGDRDYLLQRSCQKILCNETLRVENFGFSFLATHPRTDEIFVTDFQNHMVHVLNPEGEYQRSFGGEGTNPGEFHKPRAISVTPGGLVVVAEYKNHRVQILNDHGVPVKQFGSRGTGENEFWHIRGLATCDDRIYVTDYRQIKVFDFQGNPKLVFSHADVRLLYGIAVNDSGIFVNDYYAHYVFKFDFNGNLLRKIGEVSDPDDTGAMCFPSGLQLDRFGYLIVSDHGNGRLVVFDPRGDFYCAIPVEEYPWDVAIQSDTTIVVSHCRLVGYGHVNLCT